MNGRSLAANYLYVRENRTYTICKRNYAYNTKTDL